MLNVYGNVWVRFLLSDREKREGWRGGQGLTKYFIGELILLFVIYEIVL